MKWASCSISKNVLAIEQQSHCQSVAALVDTLQQQHNEGKRTLLIVISIQLIKPPARVKTSALTLIQDNNQPVIQFSSTRVHS